MKVNRDIRLEKREWMTSADSKKCRVLFVSNYLSMHQVGIWDELSQYDDIDFIFLRTGALEAEEEYSLLAEHRWYSCNSHNNMSDAVLLKMIEKADFIIRGSVEEPRVFSMLRGRPAAYAYEHFSKERSLRMLASWVKAWLVKRYVFSKKDIGLCMSSHAAFDFFLKGMRPRHIYKFGYFPRLDCASEACLLDKDPFSLIYVGRLINWKHPEAALLALKELRKNNNKWHLDYYGDGPMRHDLEKKAETLGLPSTSVVFHGFVDPALTKMIYRQSSFFIFPSDYGEGWGVVLSEALSQGCVCFANSTAGSSRYLINHKRNGFLFHSWRSLKRVLLLSLRYSPEDMLEIRRNAVRTVFKTWSGKLASERLHNLITSHYFVDFDVAKKTKPNKNGPLSKAFNFFGFIRYLFEWH